MGRKKKPPVEPPGRRMADIFAEGETLVGCRGLYTEVPRNPQYDGGALHTEVKVTEFRVQYGHIRLRIEPVAGKGFKWVNANAKALTLFT